MTVIDAQVHIWGAETPERPWPPGGAALAHRPTPLGKNELLREMDAAGVDRAIIVPPSWEGDRNDLAREAALLHPDRFAVMGRLAIERPKSRSLVDTWNASASSGGLICLPGCVALIVRQSPSSLRNLISSPTSIKPGL